MTQGRSVTAAADRFDTVVRLPFSAVGVRIADEAVVEIMFLPDHVLERPARNALAQRVVDQLFAYSADPEFNFDLPLAISGTEFQRQVWREISGIRRGSTRSYGELALKLGSTARAVGQACGDNRLPLAIPCHRVIAANGIGGFAHHAGGDHVRIKRWLLAHEAQGEFQLQ
jgi:methylated-DNA-[protein]-cysteine S-methyltransferase